MRQYETTHPWIDFRATDVNRLGPKSWMLVGEARSKCEHLAQAPLRPDVSHRLWEVALIKGAQATTAIEGNTLTEEQVEGIRNGTYSTRPSRSYQETEVTNVLDALDRIDASLLAGTKVSITADLIKQFNKEVLASTTAETGVAPGELRTHSVAVGSYRGAPAEDCEYLLDRLATWLESDEFRSEDPEVNYALTVSCAMFAHLYIAWIHPFGDGNGRTARLLEFLILARSGDIPLPAATVMSNHYNLTRGRYYAELAKASATSSAVEFLAYAIEGFVDGLRDQIDTVQQHQRSVMWINHVHETMDLYASSSTSDRQRKLVLAMESGRRYLKADLPLLTPEIARLYAKTGERTLVRDLNRLASAELVRSVGRKWIANDRVIQRFVAPLAS